MFGSFFLNVGALGSEGQFKISGDFSEVNLPIAIVENQSTGNVDVEIESSTEKDGVITTEMIPQTIVPMGKLRIDIPKYPAGASPKEYLWCKIITSNATGIGKIKVLLAGEGSLEGGLIVPNP